MPELTDPARDPARDPDRDPGRAPGRDPAVPAGRPGPSAAPGVDVGVEVLGRLAAALRQRASGVGGPVAAGGPVGPGGVEALLAAAAAALAGTIGQAAAAWAVSRDGARMHRCGAPVPVSRPPGPPERRPGAPDQPTPGDPLDGPPGWEPLLGPVADVLAARQSVEIGFPADDPTPFGPEPVPAGPSASVSPPPPGPGPIGEPTAAAPIGRSVGRFTPVRHRDRIVGVLGVLRPAPAPPFSPTDRRLLDAVVERVEAALELQDARDELAAAAVTGISRTDGVMIREELLERLAAVGGDVLFAHRFGVGTSYVSPGVERLVGFRPAEFLGDPTLARRLVHPDDRHLVSGLVERPEAFTRPLVLRIVSREGEVVHTLLRLAPVVVGGRIIGTEGLATDISTLKQQEAELAHQARSDSLTGLANRLTFREFEARSLARIERHGGTVGVLYLDLTDFKRVNDTIGHAAGDRVLVAVADRLRKVTRREDVVARLGGDEFTVLMPDIRALVEATTTAQRIIAAIEEPIVVDGHRVTVSTGVGIAITSDGTITPDELLHRADQALYAAKRQGAGRWAVHQGGAGSKTGPDDEPEVAPAPVITASALRAALAAGDLRVHYAPVVDLATGQAVAVEALVRWQHPELGLLPARRFIDQAEESGVIHGLGDWVLGQGCRQIRRWREEHGWDVGLHLNMTASQLADADTAESILVTLAAEGMAPRDLHLDIPERAIASLTPEIERTIQTLHRAGVRITLDEFGTTVSVRTLRRIPADHIKLDRSLIEALDRPTDRPRPDAGDRPTSSAGDDIVALAVRLGASLGATVGAVGVERADQLGRLAALQLVSVQGLVVGGSSAADAITWRIHHGLVSYAAELGEAGWTPRHSDVPPTPPGL